MDGPAQLEGRPIDEDGGVVNPTSGRVGTQVTISGTAFTGATSVTFGGGVTAGFTVVNDTTITTAVPAGAKNGPVTVRTPAGSASSQTFRVLKR